MKHLHSAVLLAVSFLSMVNAGLCASANNIAEAGEACDGTDLSGATCQRLGFAGGTLTCRPDRRGYVVSGCLSGGATINAASCSLADVRASIDSAQEGDTVLIPAGTCLWTSTLNVNKPLTLMGAGVKADGLEPDAIAALEGGTPTETVILDGVTTTDQSHLIVLSSTNTNRLLRLSRIRFKRDESNTLQRYGGTIRVKTTADLRNAPPFRLDHLMLENLKDRGFYLTALQGGIIDHNVVYQGGSAGTVFDGRVPNAYEKGHASWASPIEPGSTNYGSYMESNFV
jgi:hypothetical protein